jgi:hypothetical protein
MSLLMSRIISAPLLAGGLLVGICLPNLFAQQAFQPVGPPVQVGDVYYSLPAGSLSLIQPLDPKGAMTLGLSFDGIDFLGSNCQCLPPDTNAAVGNNFVVETVNVQIRVFDRDHGGNPAQRTARHIFRGVLWRRPICGVRRQRGPLVRFGLRQY